MGEKACIIWTNHLLFRTDYATIVLYMVTVTHSTFPRRMSPAPAPRMSAFLHTFVFKYASYIPCEEKTFRFEERHTDTASDLSELGFLPTSSFPNASHTFCRVLEGQQDAITVPVQTSECPGHKCLAQLLGLACV